MNINMKNIIKIAVAALASLCLFSCEMDIDKTETSPSGSFVAPVLESVGPVIVDANNNKVEAVTFNWSDASFGAPVQIVYNLYMTYGNNTALIGSSFNNSVTVSKSDLNSFACSDLGVAKNVTETMTAYLTAQIYDTNTEKLISNKITFDLTTFDSPKSCIYLPGYYQGWKDNKTEVWEMEGGTKIYRILVTFLEDATNTPGFCPFKLYDGSNWLGYNDGYTAEWGDVDFFANNDGNFAVLVGEETNFVTINMNTKTLSKERVTSLGIIGSFSASNGWGNDVSFTYDPDQNVWLTDPIDFVAGDEFLIRTNASWADSDKYGDALVASSEVAGGYELTNSGSAANIKIDNLGGAGTYIMKIYGNHTPLVLVAEKQ